jgi:ABC-type multidrug transport system ATPase subunit
MSDTICPSCRATVVMPATACTRCRLPLAWLDPLRLPEFVRELRRVGSRESTEDERRAPATIRDTTDSIRLRPEGELSFGRLQSCGRQLAHPEIDETHFVIAGQAAANRFWLVDCSRGGTFVNRALVDVHRLESGDLIQAGPYAWSFSAADGYLVPASRIDGVTVAVRGLELSGRLDVPALDVAAGDFVAITGKSGAGKSSLLKAIARLPGFRGVGRVLVDGRDVDRESAWFRELLGYLSQDAFVHRELDPLQALGFIARLRLGHDVPVEGPLRELELPHDRWERPIGRLSGGEQKRVRIASELLANPRLLLLDEPGSGLDPGREESLMRLLRGLCHRGCTVIVVTHGQEFVDRCDRVLVVEEGRIVRDGAAIAEPEAQREGEAKQPEMSTLREAASPSRCTSGSADQTAARTSFVDQFRVSIEREFALVRNDPLRRIGVPLVLVPSVFAVALHVALAGADKLHLLGFFCVLSAVWAGSSLSLLSIAGEREVFDHEQFLYLRTGSYLLAKWTVFGFLAIFQVAVLLGILWLLRAGTPAMFFGTPFVGLVLFAVELGAIAQGLLLSAVAGRNKDLANLLLPLVMIAQIVFSAQVAGQDSPRLEEAYRDFHLHACAEHPERRAIYWIPSEGGWLSDGARRARDGHDDRPTERDRQVANPWAALASYLLLSRYGDILLRSFAYDRELFDDAIGRTASPVAERFDYGRWRWEAGLGLGLLTMVFVGAAWGALRWPAGLR